MPCGCGSAAGGNTNSGNGTIASAQIQERSIITNEQVTGWNQLRNCDPKDPSLLIADAYLGGVDGKILSTIKYNPSTAWATDFLYTLPNPPVCYPLDAASGQKAADAANWNFAHLASPAGITGLPPQMYNVLFLRGGTQWKMRIPFQTEGPRLKQIMLSFFENAAMIGDCHGEIPVISFDAGEGLLPSSFDLDVTLKMFGQFHIGLTCIDDGNRYIFID